VAIQSVARITPPAVAAKVTRTDVSSVRAAAMRKPMPKQPAVVDSSRPMTRPWNSSSTRSWIAWTTDT
jgi:hypothetical protein